MLGTLRATYPGSDQARLIGMERDSDAMLWQFAKDNGFTIVTKDSDFHEMSLMKGFPPKVIWLKTGNSASSEVLGLLMDNRDAILGFLQDAQSGCLELQ